MLRTSEDVFKRAAHVDNQQDYDDIPKPTVLQLFQVSRVEIVPQVARLQLVGRGNVKQVLWTRDLQVCDVLLLQPPYQQLQFVRGPFALNSLGCWPDSTPPEGALGLVQRVVACLANAVVAEGCGRQIWFCSWMQWLSCLTPMESSTQQQHLFNFSCLSSR